jgi:hypothetical protein
MSDQNKWKIMPQKMLWRVGFLLILFLMAVGPQRVSAANVMNYGADGNDYFQFTDPSMAFDKASGFTTLITFAMHVNPDGTLLIAGVAAPMVFMSVPPTGDR